MALKKNNSFMSDYAARMDEEQRQRKLRKKHMITDDTVRVVEKDHGFLLLLKFMYQRLEGFVRFVFSALLFILASVGIIALMLETTRVILFAYFSELFHLLFFFGG